MVARGAKKMGQHCSRQCWLILQHTRLCNSFIIGLTKGEPAKATNGSTLLLCAAKAI